MKKYLLILITLGFFFSACPKAPEAPSQSSTPESGAVGEDNALDEADRILQEIEEL